MRSLVLVAQFVGGEMRRHLERFGTTRAAKWSHFAVHGQVACEMFPATERVATFTADEGFATLVDRDVLVKAGSIVEPLFAHSASMYFPAIVK